MVGVWDGGVGGEEVLVGLGVEVDEVGDVEELVDVGEKVGDGGGGKGGYLGVGGVERGVGGGLGVVWRWMRGMMVGW